MFSDDLYNQEKMTNNEHTLTQFGLILGYPIMVALTPIFLYFGVNQEIFVILCSLMFIDSFMGGIKSHRLHKVLPEKYSVWKFQLFWWGLAIKIMIAMLPFLLAILAITFSYDGKWFIDMCIKIMIVSEIYSVLGNIYAIKNKTDVKKVDAVSVLLHSMRVSLYSWLMNTLKKIEKSKDCDFKDRE